MIMINKKTIFFLYFFFLLFLIEIFSYFSIKVLSKKGVFYDPSQVKQNYNEYIKVKDSSLGWKNKNTDYYGARKDKSSFSKFNACVDVYGDSFTYGLGVDDNDAWPSILSVKLRCRVKNYGVIGYGTDQAYLKYLYKSNNSSNIVVLNHFSEGILRNINQLLNLIYPNPELALKPRFILKNNNLSLIQINSLTKLTFNELLVSPQKLLKYEYFNPLGESGVQIASFPYTITFIKAFKHYHVRAILNKESRVKEFYESKHKSEAFKITELIMKEFYRNVSLKNLTPILTIIPACRDFKHRDIYGKFPYENLSIELKNYTTNFIDFGSEIILNKINYKDLYDNCSSHMNKFGNLVLAQIFEKKLKESKLH